MKAGELAADVRPGTVLMCTGQNDERCLSHWTCGI